MTKHSSHLFWLQEIVGTLVTHIGSGYAAEADASLDVLSDLVESHPDVMAPFAIFIKVCKTTVDISQANGSLSGSMEVFRVDTSQVWALSKSSFAKIWKNDHHGCIR